MISEARGECVEGIVGQKELEDRPTDMHLGTMGLGQASSAGSAPGPLRAGRGSPQDITGCSPAREQSAVESVERQWDCPEWEGRLGALIGGAGQEQPQGR